MYLSNTDLANLSNFSLNAYNVSVMYLGKELYNLGSTKLTDLSNLNYSHFDELAITTPALQTFTNNTINSIETLSLNMPLLETFSNNYLSS